MTMMITGDSTLRDCHDALLPRRHSSGKSPATGRCRNDSRSEDASIRQMVDTGTKALP